MKKKPRRILIKVTEEDLNKKGYLNPIWGGKCWENSIISAIQRTIGYGAGVVDRGCCRETNIVELTLSSNVTIGGKNVLKFKLPRSALRFEKKYVLGQFDNGRGKPFNFYITEVE